MVSKEVNLKGKFVNLDIRPRFLVLEMCGDTHAVLVVAEFLVANASASIEVPSQPLKTVSPTRQCNRDKSFLTPDYQCECLC